MSTAARFNGQVTLRSEFLGKGADGPVAHADRGRQRRLLRPRLAVAAVEVSGQRVGEAEPGMRDGEVPRHLVEPIELAAREIVSHGRAPSSWPLGFSFAGKIVDRLGGKNAGVHGGELRPHQGGDQRGQRLYPEETPAFVGMRSPRPVRGSVKVRTSTRSCPLKRLRLIRTSSMEFFGTIAMRVRGSLIGRP